MKKKIHVLLSADKIKRKVAYDGTYAKNEAHKKYFKKYVYEFDNWHRKLYTGNITNRFCLNKSHSKSCIL